MKKNIDNFIIVGKLNKKYLKAIKLNVKNNSLYISKNNLKHIEKKHKIELQGLGITAQMFLETVIINFNRIYQDKKTKAYFLVIYNEDKADGVVLQVNLALKNEFLEIKTAVPYRTAYFNNKILLFTKGAKPS